MNIIKGLILWLGLTVAGFSVWADAYCQGYTLCVHTNMPLLDQSSPTLLSIVNRYEGLNKASDPGYCVPTSSVIALTTVKCDSGGYRTSYGPGTLDSSNDYYNVYLAGEYMRTDWVNGGTSWGNASSGAQQIALGYSGWQQYYNDNNVPSIDYFKKTMPALVIGVGPKFLLWHTSGHQIALNGVESYYYKIYDPWFRIYNVMTNSDRNELYSATGWGYVMSKGTISINYSAGMTRPAIERGGTPPPGWGGSLPSDPCDSNYSETCN